MSNPADAESRPASEAALERRSLQSWKEIAAHLGVTLRTAARWHQRDGLPVHRMGSGPKARVMAYTDELDAWVRRANHRAPDPDAAPGPSAKVVRRLSWRWIAGVTILLAALAVVISWVLPTVLARVPEHLVVESGAVAVYDAQNNLCWRQPYPGLDGPVYEPLNPASKGNATPAFHDAALVADIDADGRREVLFNYWPKTSYESAGRLICFEHDGRVRWQFTFGRARSFGERHFSAIYQGILIRLVRAHGRTFVLSVSHHDHWFPAHAVLLDPRTGKVHQEYWHAGWIYVCNSHDLDGDGSEEILLTGLNNPGPGLGHIGLAVLRVAVTPQAPAPDRVAADLNAFAGSTPIAYRLFPRSDMIAVASMNPIADILAIQEGREILLRVGGPNNADIVYHLDFALTLKDFRLADTYAAAHAQYERRGLLDHALTEDEIAELGKVMSCTGTPDGNSPEVNRYWRLR